MLSDCCLVQLSEEPSHIDMHQTPLIVKRAEYIARFDDIDVIYHVMPVPQFITRWVGVLRMAIKVPVRHIPFLHYDYGYSCQNSVVFEDGACYTDGRSVSICLLVMHVSISSDDGMRKQAMG